MRVLASADAVWMEYWMLDEITAAPLQGNDFLGYLAHDNVSSATATRRATSGCLIACGKRKGPAR